VLEDVAVKSSEDCTEDKGGRKKATRNRRTDCKHGQDEFSKAIDGSKRRSSSYRIT